jgi:hypothetical protein
MGNNVFFNLIQDCTGSPGIANLKVGELKGNSLVILSSQKHSSEKETNFYLHKLI